MKKIVEWFKADLAERRWLVPWAISIISLLNSVVALAISIARLSEQ